MSGASQAVTEHVDQSVPLPAISVPTSNPVMDMIRQSIAAGHPLDLAVIREVKDLAKEMAADEAERAFNAAFAAFKSEIVVVTRTREVSDGPLKGRRYAELYSFVDAATPALAKHGLSHSWSVTRDEKDWIEVTCTIQHSLGGKATVKQGGPPDTGGAKNALQARISTVTYLQRVTFKSICGLAERGDDDDGKGGAPAAGTIAEQQVEELQALIDKAVAVKGGDRAEWLESFLEYLGVPALLAIRAKDFGAAKAEIERAINGAKK